jgi:carbonic anhydrase/acetyltransferase-like protein (isoleucine patch superfamily)
VNPSVVLFPFAGKLPVLGKGTFVAPTAFLAGDVTAGRDCSFWPAVSARGDVHHVRVGDETNVQDGSVLHVTMGDFPLCLGSRVTVGHGAVLHGCTVGDDCLLGIGCRVLDGATVEPFSIVGAGCLVPPGFTVPTGQVVMGTPAAVVRALRPDEREMIRDLAARYVELKDRYLREA